MLDLTKMHETGSHRSINTQNFIHRSTAVQFWKESKYTSYFTNYRKRKK